LRPIMNECFLNECATRMYHVASSVVDVLRVATDGGARELLRVVLGLAPVPAFTIINIKAVRTNRCAVCRLFTHCSLFHRELYLCVM